MYTNNLVNGVEIMDKWGEDLSWLNIHIPIIRWTGGLSFECFFYQGSASGLKKIGHISNLMTLSQSADSSLVQKEVQL